MLAQTYDIHNTQPKSLPNQTFCIEVYNINLCQMSYAIIIANDTTLLCQEGTTHQNNCLNFQNFDSSFLMKAFRFRCYLPSDRSGFWTVIMSSIPQIVESIGLVG